MEQESLKVLEEFLINSKVDIDLGNFAVAIFSSLILGIIVKYTYLKVSKSINDKEHF